MVFVNPTDELRQGWRGRLLAKARGKTGAVLLSVITHQLEEYSIPLLKAVWPGFIEPSLPCLCSAGRIAKSGAIYATILSEMGRENRVLYKSEIEMRDDFRRLADRVKLTDNERILMFASLQNWIVADYRLDPTMDPLDPDARRLVH